MDISVARSFLHELCELKLHRYLGDMAAEAVEAQYAEHRDSEFYSDEAESVTDEYVAFCVETIEAVRSSCPDPLIMVEHRVDYSEYVPEGFGTGDLVIVADGVIEVVDFKSGRGVRVDAHRNSQLMLYALGALLEFDSLYDIHHVRMTIVQPRLNNLSSYEMEADELLRWAEIESPSKRVKPTGEYVAAGVGEGMSGYDFSADAQDAASGIESALQAALTGESLKNAGTAAAQGLSSAMAAYPMTDTGRSLAANVRSAVQSNLNGNTLRSAGINVMAGLRAGILAGRSGVISAMRSAAREAVNAAKKVQRPALGRDLIDLHVVGAGLVLLGDQIDAGGHGGGHRRTEDTALRKPRPFASFVDVMHQRKLPLAVQSFSHSTAHGRNRAEAITRKVGAVGGIYTDQGKSTPSGHTKSVQPVGGR